MALAVSRFRSDISLSVIISPLPIVDLTACSFSCLFWLYPAVMFPSNGSAGFVAPLFVFEVPSFPDWFLLNPKEKA
jgi:hypothetical protein